MPLTDHTKPGRRGQFFTPPSVAEFMWRVVAELVGEKLFDSRVIDPSSGEGVFLCTGLRMGLIREDKAMGIELDAGLKPRGMARLARTVVGDALLGQFAGVVDGSFDVVIGNPPFGRISETLPAALVLDLGRDGGGRFDVWRSGAKNGEVEQLFLDRALQLVKPGGIVAFVMPEGFLANDRARVARDWVLERAEVLAIASLPESAFRRPGLNATADVIVLRRRSTERDRDQTDVAMVGRRRIQKTLANHMQDLSAQVLHLHKRQGRQTRQAFRLAHERLRGSRWDVSYWRGTRSSTGSARFQQALIGDFIEHITYGPIVTGRRPDHVEGGIRVIRQNDFADTGLKVDDLLRVENGCVYDPPRSRVRKGDLLLPRSGAGSLGRNRLAVYVDAPPANVACFVDRIRLSGVNPFFVWFYLRSAPGWAQIRSVINGVGTPNINFSEIRALRLPLIPEEEQRLMQRRYLQEVLPAHKRSGSSDSARRRAEGRFRAIISDIERIMGFVSA